MKIARYYIVLICVLCLSVVLLGLSYSSYSGTTKDQRVNEIVNDWGRIVYSSNELATSDNDQVDIGVTNLTDGIIPYVITVKEKGNRMYDDIYYTVNDEPEKKLDYDGDHIIYKNELSIYGNDGDYNLNKVHIYSKTNKNLVFILNVEMDNKEELDEGIIDDSE